MTLLYIIGGFAAYLFIGGFAAYLFIGGFLAGLDKDQNTDSAPAWIFAWPGLLTIYALGHFLSLPVALGRYVRERLP